MIITFGMHRGKSVELVALKDPGYVAWMRGQADARGRLARIRLEAVRLVRRFDLIPFEVACAGRGCHHTATRGAVYPGAVDPTWWCDDCAPSGFGSGRLVFLATYEDAVGYVATHCNGRRESLRLMIIRLARAKGLPARVGEQQAAAFFA